MKKLLSLTTLFALILSATVSSAALVTTIAGGGINPPATGLTATDVEIGEIYSSKVDNNGNLYIANYPQAASGLWVTRVNKWGKIDRLHENQTTPIKWFDDISIDSAGNIFLPAYDENVVYKVTPDGTTSVYAGDGTFGFSGDGGPATSAQLESPESISIDQDDNVYVSHMGSNPIIRKIDKQGTISLFFDGTGLGYGLINTIFSNGPENVYLSEGNNLWKVTGQNTAVKIASIISTNYGITGDSYGNIYYSFRYYDNNTSPSTKHNMVKKIDPFGIETTLIDDTNSPQVTTTRLSTDMDGMLYINNYVNPTGSRIDKLAFTPGVEAVLPLDGAVGERVTISGRYFGSNGIGGSVTFGGITAPILSWSNDIIVCDIPAGTSKTVDVVVTAKDTQTSNLFSYRIR